MKTLWIIFSLQLLHLSQSSGAKILVVPHDGSHWINMKVILEELHAKGHELTVVYMEQSWYIRESHLYTSISTPGPNMEELFNIYISQHIELRLQVNTGFWSRMWTQIQMNSLMVDHFRFFHSVLLNATAHILEDKNLIQSLKDAKFDLVLTDPSIGCGSILAHYLQLPLVYNAKWTLLGEAHFSIAPSPLSYVPFATTELTDKMTFLQRIKNCITYVIGTYTMSAISEPVYKPVLKQYFGPEVDYSVFFSDADIWLIRNDFIFDFPRPTMPNVVYISGFQCKPPKALPAHLEEFVQSSGDHGVIVMSMGSLISKLPPKVSEEIAAAFARLPQKVVWRYLGQKPANLGNNTLLLKWFPQKDLLGHPKTKAFVTHGGMSGVQEAIYNEVPMIGIPIFFDQSENVSKLKAMGLAVMVDIALLERQMFGEALNAVLNDPSYRENMKRLSRLQKDRPMKPMDQAVFWIEHVARHKGARHLKSESIKMSWFVYHSLDVIAVLLSGFLMFTCSCVYLAKFLWRSWWQCLSW